MNKRVMIEVDDKDLDDFIERGIVRAEIARNAVLLTESDDAVSRQAVNDLYDRYHPTLATCVYELGEELKALPSVNPYKHGKWISVKERLPQKTSLYLVTVGINDYGMGMYDEVRVAHYNIISGWCVCEDRRTIIGDVSAWMPLPEPYKAESEDKE